MARRALGYASIAGRISRALEMATAAREETAWSQLCSGVRAASSISLRPRANRYPVCYEGCVAMPMRYRRHVEAGRVSRIYVLGRAQNRNTRRRRRMWLFGAVEAGGAALRKG